MYWRDPACRETNPSYGWLFGHVRIRSGKNILHKGFDMCYGGYGKPVRAAASGTVSFAGQSSGSTLYMIYINHGGGYESRYMHVIPGSILVKAGQYVKAGQQIGSIGCSGIVNQCTVGSDISGSHLHFEIYYNKTPIDPRSALDLSKVGRATVVLPVIVGSLASMAAFRYFSI